MQNNDYLTFLGTCRTKLVKLLGVLNHDPIKYEVKIIEVQAMIKVVDYLKDEYYKTIINSLEETGIFSTHLDKT